MQDEDAPVKQDMENVFRPSREASSPYMTILYCLLAACAGGGGGSGGGDSGGAGAKQTKQDGVSKGKREKRVHGNRKSWEWTIRRHAETRD